EIGCRAAARPIHRHAIMRTLREQVLAALAERGFINLRLEADEELAVRLQYGTLDHGRLRSHERDGLLFREAVLVLVGQSAERRAGAVEEHLPARLLHPGFELGPGDARRLIVVKRTSDAAAVEPSARLLHRVAVLDSIDRHRHGAPRSISF